MKYPWLDQYLLTKQGAEHDFKIEWQWERYLLRGKMFAAICNPEEKYQTYGGHPLVNLKCDPRLAEAFRETYPEVLPGFYMDKVNWIAVLLDGNLSDDVLRELCDNSYRLIFEKLPKKVQREIVE